MDYRDVDKALFERLAKYRDPRLPDRIKCKCGSDRTRMVSDNRIRIYICGACNHKWDNSIGK